MRPKKASHYVVFIAAQVHSTYCLDMLRYDSCCPASEQESARLDRAISTGEAAWVIFKRFVMAGAKPEPTHARWASFNQPTWPDVFSEYHQAEDMLHNRGLR